MKIARHLSIILLFSVKISIAQNNSFTKNYEVWNEYAMHNFQRTADGGYILSSDAMFEMDPVTNLGKGYLIKMDNAGNTQWSKEFVKTGGSIKPSDGCSVFQCSDQGYIVSGVLYDSLGNGIIRLFRTDVSGNLLWSKLYPGLGISAAYCVRQTADGGYIVSGYTLSPLSQIAEPYILKTDANGIPQFGKVIVDPNGYSGEAFSVKQTSSGGYIYCGSDAFLPFVGMLNAQGNSVWHKKFTGINGDFNDVIQNSNGSFTLTGDVNSNTFMDLSLVNIDVSGNVNWDRFYNVGNYFVGFSLKETTGGRMIASSQSTFGQFMTLFNSSGNIIWNRCYLNYFTGIPSTVDYANGSGYAFSATGSFSTSISVVKTDTLGHTTCGDSDYVFTQDQLSYTFLSDLTFIDSMPHVIDNFPLINKVLNQNYDCTPDSILPNQPIPCETFFFIPNVFSPNGDHMNDVFRDSVVTCDPEYKMMIYDRWGSVVFESKVSTQHWDGTSSNGGNASEGTYYYVLVTKEKTLKGFLTLLR